VEKLINQPLARPEHPERKTTKQQKDTTVQAKPASLAPVPSDDSKAYTTGGYSFAVTSDPEPDPDGGITVIRNSQSYPIQVENWVMT
jgi:hypothetical protein